MTNLCFRIQPVVIFAGLFSAMMGCADKTPPSWDSDGVLEAEVDGVTVTLRWPAAHDDALMGFVIFRNGEEVSTVGAEAREHQLSRLDDSTSYELTVEARDESGNRSEPLHVTATTADGTPPHWIVGAALRITEPEIGDPEAPVIILQWDPAQDQGGLATYRVMRGDSVISEQTSRHHEVDEALTDELRAAVSVVAVDTAGNVSAPLVWREGAVAVVVAAPGVEDEAAVAPAVGEGGVSPSLLPVPSTVVPSVKLNPSQSAIIDRVRQMGFDRRKILRATMRAQTGAPGAAPSVAPAPTR